MANCYIFFRMKLRVKGFVNVHRGKISSCGVHLTKSMCPINFMHLFEAPAITCNRMHNMHFN